MATKEDLLKQLQELKKMRDEVAAMPDEEEAPAERPELKAEPPQAEPQSIPEPTPKLMPEPTAAESAKKGAEAFLKGGAYGATLGAAPAIEAAASQVGTLMKGQLPPLPGTPEFRQMVLERQKPYQQLKKERPVEFGVGEFAGTLATGGGLSMGAAKAGTAAAELIPTTAPLARGLTRVGTEAALEAGIGAGTAAVQGQDVTQGALIGGAGSLGGQLLRSASEIASQAPKAQTQFTQALRESAVESAPEQLKPAAQRFAKSPEALEEASMARYELTKTGGLEDQLSAKKVAEEAKFKQLQEGIEEANKAKTVEFQAALSEEDKAQQELLKQSIAAVKRSRSTDAANKMSEAIDRGLKIQQQKAKAKYDIVFKDMVDQVPIEKSQAQRIIQGFSQLEPSNAIYSPETVNTLARIQSQIGTEVPGGWTSGKEFQSLIDIDQSLNADLRRLIANQTRQGSTEQANAINKLSVIKQELQNSIQSKELGLPKEAIDQYNQAKAHYAEFADMRDELRKAKLVVEQKIDKKRTMTSTAEAAQKFLEPKVEDYAKTARVQQILGRLPSDVEDVPAMTAEQFMRLKQQATTMPAGLLPERTRPAIQPPELQPIPTQRVMTPEEIALEGQVLGKRTQAEEFEGLSKMPVTQAPPKDWGVFQPVANLNPLTGTPIQKLSRANTIDKVFQKPGLTFAIRVLEGQKKAFTLPLIQNLARQYQVDPGELQQVLEQTESP